MTSKIALVPLLLLPLLAAGCSRSSAGPAVVTPAERGKYLVENVGMCADCHSPRGPDGNYVQEQWLQGGKLAFGPLVPMPWADYAPSIAGLERYSDAELMSLFTTGHFINGNRLRPPMPAFMLNEQDASDMIAYLRSFERRPASS